MSQQGPNQSKNKNFKTSNLQSPAERRSQIPQLPMNVTTSVPTDTRKKIKVPRLRVDRTAKMQQFFDKFEETPAAEEKDNDSSSAGSEISAGSQHDYHRRKATANMSMAPEISKMGAVSKDGMSVTSTDTSISISVESDSLDSSIHRFRDDFDEFKCKMKIFGESLNLCKCIANDFKGRLAAMEGKLYGLEKRQKKNKMASNYTDIIKKNKQMETKTKVYVDKLQKCGTEEEMREVAGRICKNYLHGLWKVVNSQELKFRRISGGLSNFIYVVGLPDDLKPLYTRLNEIDEDEAKGIRSAIECGDEPKQVLLRIYGQVHGERAMDAIVTESVIFTLLSERRLGPKLFGVFSGGRIEEFIPARPLVTKEMAEPALSMKIAEKTAAIHSMEIPLSKEPNYIWKTMYKWLKTVKEECFTNGLKGKNPSEQIAIKRLKEINYDHEIEWLKKYLVTFDSQVVFCHNDLQEGNILYLEGDHTMATTDEFEPHEYMPPQHSAFNAISEHEEQKEDNSAVNLANSSRSVQPLVAVQAMAFEETEEDTTLSEPPGEPKLYLIDFEYCAYNYRAFDIANHFQEWAYDYTNPEHPFYYERQEDWPTLEQKEIFIREYLKHFHAFQNEDKLPTDPDIDAVNKLLSEVEAFALASHLFWTLWSIVNASKSQIPFGYWEYGHSRLETYLRLKQEVIKKEQFGLPQKRKIEEVDI